MPRTDEEFHQVLIVLEHICDVSGVTKLSYAGVLLPILNKTEVYVQLPITTMWSHWRCDLANKRFVKDISLPAHTFFCN